MTESQEIASRLAQGFSDRWDQSLFVDVKTGRDLSYGQALHQGIALAARMEQAGVCVGDHVAIICRNSSEFATAFLSCLYLGAVAVPIDLRLGSDEKSQLIKQSCPRVILLGEAYGNAYHESHSKLQVIDMGSLSADLPSSDARVKRNDLLGLIRVFEKADSPQPYLISFTSGTTSKPKGVCHSARSLFLAALEMNERTAVNAGSVFYHCFSMSYMAGILNLIICPIVAGARIVIDDPFDFKTAIKFWPLIEKFKCNIFWLAPSMMALIEKMDRASDTVKYSSQHVDNVLVGTAPLPLRVRESFVERYRVSILESYGLTETLFVSSDSASRRIGDTGPLLDSVEVRFVGTGERERLQEGEVRVRSPWNFLGYLDDETNTVVRTEAKWFPTGDYGLMTTAGSLRVTSRIKDLIIRGGVNISPKRIEDVLIGLEIVEEVAVVGLPDELEGEEIVAAVVLSGCGGTEQAITRLFEFSLDNLDVSVRPKRFIPVMQIPKTSNGKVNKRELKKSLIAK